MDTTKIEDVICALRRAEWHFGDGSKVEVKGEFINGYHAQGFLVTISMLDLEGGYYKTYYEHINLKTSLCDFLEAWAKDHNGFNY